MSKSHPRHPVENRAVLVRLVREERRTPTELAREFEPSAAFANQVRADLAVGAVDMAISMPRPPCAARFLTVARAVSTVLENSCAGCGVAHDAPASDHQVWDAQVDAISRDVCLSGTTRPVTAGHRSRATRRIAAATISLRSSMASSSKAR